VHIEELIAASMATFAVDENLLENGPGNATLGRGSSHVTTVEAADALIPLEETVNTKTCVPGDMTPAGMEMRGFDVDIILDATTGAAKQGDGEHDQAYNRSALEPSEEPDKEPSMVKEVACECCKFAAFNLAKRVLLGARTSKANDEEPALELTNNVNLSMADEETFFNDNSTEDCVTSTPVNGL